ncbi:MAG TPA: TatD family hydrolase [Syntrophales bacterium]|jgi:TatD DNase family protein|nr:TatD family hydrolase [Syntrophales bacterium]HON23146.1 TatD family hydrolase [Syntrophales bacterium]HOU76870.1 TatD family hydrolase [Syntrophales bacterium]HPC31639.1 TatD family hydrolase [Syntrophales bacterium]HQG35069.1 TatD family hydrolase [Syntrophales bacterium]
MFIDSHAHLEMRDFDRDREEVIRRATAAGVDYVVTVGTNLRECRKAVEIARTHPAVYAAVGIHPHDVRGIDAETYDVLKALARNEAVVAYGEIGLDFFRNLSPPEMQLRCFEEQLEVAAALGLPVIIHDREAHEDTVAVLKKRQGTTGGVIHCFSGDTAMAMTCLEMGFYISIAGPVTYARSDRLWEVVRQVPLDRMLIETDAPYLTPHPRRGRRNEPACVVLTAEKIAALKGLSLDEVGRVTARNARQLFGIPRKAEVS